MAITNVKNDLKKYYNALICIRWKALLMSEKEIFDNYDLSKIFEWYCCIKLFEMYGQEFWEYNDIDPNYKEIHKMSKSDTGIDLCNLVDTIVQCKLREKNLMLNECSTFFSSNIGIDDKNELYVKWKKMIITRNSDSKLSKNLINNPIFTDVTFDKSELINYCNQLQVDENNIVSHSTFYVLRDYQEECIQLINETNNKNIVICLPTGSGKNLIVIQSIQPNKKTLLLVPYIILMHQFKREIKKYRKEIITKVQFIGDGNIVYDKNKNITICVYNSIHKIPQDELQQMNKIYVDEAHHIKQPLIYCNDEENKETNGEENNETDGEENKETDGEENNETNGEENKETDGEENNETNGEENNETNGEENNETNGEENKEKYLDIIRNLNLLNNNVYISATIDKIIGWVYYFKDIRYMIEHKYLSDYNIHIPVFIDNPTHENVCKYLIDNYEYIIVYCSSQNEGKLITTIFNKLQKNCAQYVDCYTSKKDRKNTTNKYERGEIMFLVNVEILVEGFDAPITRGICFFRIPASNVKSIQCIGRALRNNVNKKIARIVLPYFKEEDSFDIDFCIKTIAKNDSRIRESYIKKKMGGYINIDIEGDSTDDNHVMYEKIINSLGVCINNTEIWYMNLEKVKLFIDENGIRPSTSSKNKNEKFLGHWISNQITNYKTKSKIMKNDEIYNSWTKFISSEKYESFLMSNIEIWYMNLEKVKLFIDENDFKPSSSSKNKNEKFLGYWINHQITNYKTKSKIMKNDEIYNSWTKFISSEKYESFLMSNIEIWYMNLEKVKLFIDENDFKPSSSSKNKNEKILGHWISNQITNYKTKSNIMKNDEIYNSWTKIISSEKYESFFYKNNR